MNAVRFSKGAGSFKWLFFSLILAFVLVPFFQGHLLAEELIASAYTLVLLNTLYTLHGKHHHFWRIAGLAAATLISNVFSYLSPYLWVDNLSMALNVAFYLYAIVLTFESVFRNSKVTMNVILGAVCIYLLIGVVWGMGYSLLDSLIPHAFQMTPVDNAITQMDKLVQHFIYFSFTTLSTLGYGDITPLATPVRYLASLEAICGQIYLSVLVARLVGMHITQK